ncbi:Replication factor A protein 1 [Saccharomyces pastorianus]|uniref:Replication factor A protein 1 n=1 Tax=Saccharomyces pastorianus TaxID=27292 RepID=A0A6C1DKY4_SACPS|nr:Replication factor A protein 1 [Saccharomyces pastorianus]
MSSVQLSKGDFHSIFTNKQRKNLIMISDGIYHMKALLRNQAASKFQSMELQRGDIIRVIIAEPAIVRERRNTFF